MRDYLRTEVDDKGAAPRGVRRAPSGACCGPTDPNDGRNVIVEIRGAEGGEEANLWAGDLFQMYEGFAKRHGWKTEVLSSQPSDMGGFREGTLVVKGDDAWARLKYEAGPHRVQRFPSPRARGASTRVRRRSRCSPKPRRSTSTSTRTTSTDRCSAPVARAGSVGEHD